MKVHIVQHNDADGYSAAYLVYKYIKSFSPEIKFWVMSYSAGQDEELLKEVEENDVVYIVDYSFNNPKNMIELLKKTKNVTWIDHHQTAINTYDEWRDLIKEATGVGRISGIRLVGLCGAALTYLYLYKGWKDEEFIELKSCSKTDEEVLNILSSDFEKAPKWLRLVNDYDVWNNQMLPDSKYLNIATSGNLSIELYEELDNDELEDKLVEYLCKGETFLEYRDIYARSLREAYGYSKLTTWFGDTYSVYFLNVGMSNSDYFGPEIFNHDICCTFCRGKEETKFSLYSQTPGIDCGVIAKKFGGGGHAGAAGFSLNNEKAELIM